MSNQKIADAAHAAMNDKSFESRPGYCSRFVRQIVASVYGAKYNGLFGASAIDTGKNFKRTGMDASVTQSSQLEVGDILFKMQGSGGFGHVGIYVGSNGVASNSSTPLGRVSGAKGYRTLGQWGQWQLVGRLPGDSPAAADKVTTAAGKASEKETPVNAPVIYHLMLNDVKVVDMPVIDGRAYCPVRLWGSAMGFDVDWNETTHHVMFNGKEIPLDVTILQEHAFLPITDLVKSAGLKITTNDPEKHLIVVSK